MIHNIKNSEKDILISKLLQKNSIDFKMPCGGNRTCGKCKVKISGDISPISENEKKFLSYDEIQKGYRLACFAKTSSDITVTIENTKFNQILTKGMMDNFIFDPIIDDEQYGLSIDIGTTTVVTCLFKGDSRKCISMKSDINSQNIYGADVISRINYSINNSVLEVNKTIINQINEMINSILGETEVNIDLIKYIVVTGNTIMLHFFANLDTKNIAFYPFTPASLFGEHLENNLGLNVPSDCKIYIPPCVSAYIGSDLLCCILSCNMIDIDETSFIVDIGTNGEMALYKDNQLLCCSTAAGPAFEGANLKCGTPAIEGAICNVYYDSSANSIKYETINNAQATGICGSGIVDAIAVLLDLNIIDKTGRLLESTDFSNNIFISDNDEIYFKFNNSDVCITQKDIRQIQLAKGAIAGGIETLLAESNVDSKEIDSFYICGGFGTYLNLISAEKIGLIPDIITDKVKIIGNGAIAGASQIILNKNSINKINYIKNKCTYIELSLNEKFMDKYIENMNFK